MCVSAVSVRGRADETTRRLDALREVLLTLVRIFKFPLTERDGRTISKAGCVIGVFLKLCHGISIASSPSSSLPQQRRISMI